MLWNHKFLFVYLIHFLVVIGHNRLQLLERIAPFVVFFLLLLCFRIFLFATNDWCNYFLDGPLHEAINIVSFLISFEALHADFIDIFNDHSTFAHLVVTISSKKLVCLIYSHCWVFCRIWNIGLILRVPTPSICRSAFNFIMNHLQLMIIQLITFDFFIKNKGCLKLWLW